MNEERWKSLKKRGDWVRLQDDVLKALIDPFDTLSDEYFGQFVKMSETYHLLYDDYLEISESKPESRHLPFLLSQAIHEKGKKMTAEHLAASDRDERLVVATMCHYYATIIDSYNFGAYISLACAFSMGGNTAKALEYLEEGAVILQKLKNSLELLHPKQREELEKFDTKLLDQLKEEFGGS